MAIGDDNLIVNDFGRKWIAFISDGYDRRSSRLYFLDIRKELFVDIWLGCDHDDRALFVDEGDGPVLQLA